MPPFAIPVDRQIELARQIFPDLVHLGNGICQATCPGIACHHTADNPRDFRLWFEASKNPHEKCLHASCETARAAAMSRLYSLLRRHDPTTAARAADHRTATRAYAAAPTTARAPMEPYDPTEAARAASLCPTQITEEWLRNLSPIRIPSDPTLHPALLLDSLYSKGDKILIFTKFASQGQLLHEIGGETLRLEERPPAYGQTTPRRPATGFPRGADGGVWFLSAPVTGDWQPNENNRDQHGAKLGRRHAACCTKYPYLVLESDEAPPAIWLNILAQLADPIVAVYTSGGKSYHALIRVNCDTKEAFDLRRTHYCTRLCALGADPAAITAVRLTRLPGCLRYGTGTGATYKPYLDENGAPAPRMQTLLYLNPHADGRPMLDLAAACKH